jgi:hypothetical protein
MAVKWGPTGVASLGPGLDSETKEQLSTILTAWGKPKSAVIRFLDEVDGAVGSYRGMQELREKSLPANVRSELTRARKTAEKLDNQLRSIGQYSIWLISSGVDRGDEYSRVLRNTAEILTVLNMAKERTDELPKSGGRLPDGPKLVLAAHIAFAMSKKLGIKVTATRLGRFEEILETILGDIEQKPRETVHDLALKALKAPVIESPDGVLEFDPKVD